MTKKAEEDFTEEFLFYETKCFSKLNLTAVTHVLVLRIKVNHKRYIIARVLLHYE